MRVKLARKPRILCIYTFPLPDRGGGFCLPTHAIDILKERCQITFFLPSQPDWDFVNAKFNSNISESDVQVEIDKPMTRWFKLLNSFFYPGTLSPDFRRMTQCYDLCICFANIGYVGRPTVHFVTDVSALDAVGIKRPQCRFWTPSCLTFRDRAQKKITRVVKFGLRFLRSVYGSQRRLRKALIKNGDRVVANSRWIASFFEKENFLVDLLYPPVTAEFPYFPFAQRGADFVCIGRIVSLKRIEKMIEILAEVRRRSGREFQFHIAGQFADAPYPRFIKELASRHSWITLEGFLFGAEKEKFLTDYRYAIHACEFEAFGIAVAEYLKAGCIPFVPNEGGAAEVVGFPELCYADTEDAVEKICCFLEKDETEQAEMQARTLERGRLFAIEKFDEDFIDFIGERLAERGFPGVLRGVN